MGCSSFCNLPICDQCIKKINFINGKCCYLCGFELIHDQALSNNICAKCIDKPPIFSAARSVFLYNENSKYIIHGFKFKDAIYAHQLFGRWMIDYGEEIISMIDVIVPVPLHRFRLFCRGYNQASLLANFIAKDLNINIDYCALRRVKNTSFQSQLTTYKKRIANVKNAFVINNLNFILNKNVLLVDDVLTTGATALACADVLMKNGANSVKVLTLARAKIN